MEEGPSPFFMQETEGVWDQNCLAKALLQMKETEFLQLRFSEGGYKPYEYERWIRAITRNLTASHPEMGQYWERIVSSADSVYNKYLNDVSATRVSFKPTKVLCRIAIERRMEHKIRTVLMSAVPLSINHQCNFAEDLTCAQILCRAMILAGPASREDRKQTVSYTHLTLPKKA